MRGAPTWFSGLLALLTLDVRRLPDRERQPLPCSNFGPSRIVFETWDECDAGIFDVRVAARLDLPSGLSLFPLKIVGNASFTTLQLSVYGVKLTPHCAIEDATQTDLILLTAPHPNTYEGIVRKTSLVPWLRAAYGRGAYLGGVCSGVVFVAETELLDGRRATTHWGVADLFRQRYPNVV